MMRKSWAWPAITTLATGLLLSLGLAAGCGGGGESSDNAGGSSASGGAGGSSGSGGMGGGLGGSGGEILPDSGGPNACGNNDPSCNEESIGPSGDPPIAFPLPSDDPAPDNVEADGVTRDQNGFISLDSSKAQFDFLWVANDLNYGMGTVSKIRTTPFSTAPIYREAARYVTVTCMSDPDNGSNENIVLGQAAPAPLCADGIHGCCSRAEATPGANGGHQPVQVIGNRPSRTAVDINGDVWVANRAHGLQSSATKIANSEKDCIDRNGNGVIETSKDVNADGIITTDCDENNLPDNGSTVCTGTNSHEFFGLDDECVLFTTNTGSTTNLLGRPLALGPGQQQTRTYGASDAWAGTHTDGVFYRIHGNTGAIIATVPILPQNGVASTPYGAAIDKYGILWAPNQGTGHLFYFDTNNPSNQGMVTYPEAHGGGFYGIAMDGYKEIDPNTGDPVDIQQVWLGDVGGSAAYRYRPKRDGTFEGLAQGTWAYANFEGGPTRGRGLGVDNRSPTSFVWVALDGYPSWTGHIGRVPYDVLDGVTTLTAAGNTFDTTQGMTTGAGVAFDGDIWGINQDSSSAVHFKVDDQGNVVGGPDVVPLDDKPNSPENFCGQGTCKPHPYTYSDFTGFGLRNFTNPQGYYAWVQEGHCEPGKTKFLKVEWDAFTPPGTSITLSVRTADSKTVLENSPWIGTWDASPAVLENAPGPLDPNPTNFIEVLFELTTQNDDSPKLKSFQIIASCEQDVVPK